MFVELPGCISNVAAHLNPNYKRFSLGMTRAQPFCMAEQFDALRERTKRFGFDIIDLVKATPHNVASDAIGRQLIRAATSVSANHRAAGRARSRKEFIAKLGLVVEEADEAEF